MLKNYFLITLRKLFNNKNYFLLSFTGFSICIAAALMIAMFIANELSYDTFHSKSSRIISINSRFNGESESRVNARIPFPAKPILLNSYPEIEKVVRMYRDVQVRPVLQHGDARYMEDNLVYTDPELFQVLDFQLISGEKENPFPATNSILVTEQSALRYFGEDNPIGKTIRYQNSVNLTVTGVVKTPPTNSHIQFDFLMPVEFQRLRWKVPANNYYDLEEDWNWHGAWTYVLLKENTNAEDFARKISEIPSKYYPSDEQNDYTFETQPIADIHLNSETVGNMSPSGSKQQLMLLAAISALLIIIAAINYTNLATVHFMNRLKEAGLRQTLGAKKRDIVLQLVGESVTVVCFSLLIGLALAQLTQPFFAPLFDNSLSPDILFDPIFLGSCLLGAVIVGIVSALYPAIIVSRYPAFRIFRNAPMRQNTSLFSVRSMLIMVQLGMSTLLVMGVLLVRDQIAFIKDKDLGYKKDNILTLKNAIAMGNYEGFRNSVANLRGVEQVYRGYFPGGTTSRYTFHVQGIAQPLPMYLRFIGSNFLETFDIPLVYGRAFPQDNPDSTRYMLVNEKAVTDLGWTNEEAIGKIVTYTGGNDNKTVYKLEIIGVIKDANFESLYNPIQASFFQPMDGGDVAIRLDGRSISQTVTTIEEIWKKTEPNIPIEHRFLSETLHNQYQKEEKLSQAILYFTSLAIAICCVGLIGLTSFITQQRTKEIGIRKVHGASVKEIVRLFISYFLKLSVMALTVSIPLGMYVSKEWLQHFAYHTELGGELVLECILISVTLSIVSVVSKVVQAAGLNPVASIKHE